jgi:hypothetical protein
MFTAATTNLIKAVLGPDTDPQVLRRRHAEGSADDHLAGLVLDAARRMSELEENLRQRAGSVAGVLTRLTATLDAGQSGNPHGVLQSTGLDIDLLAARHAEAHHWLVSTLSAYRAATAGQ